MAYKQTANFDFSAYAKQGNAKQQYAAKHDGEYTVLGIARQEIRHRDVWAISTEEGLITFAVADGAAGRRSKERDRIIAEAARKGMSRMALLQDPEDRYHFWQVAFAQ